MRRPRLPELSAKVLKTRAKESQKPVEAAIALSIACVASELVKAQSGPRRLSEAYPWIVAFAFGLLHGFGFAGALKETGLRQVDVRAIALKFLPLSVI